VNWIKNFVRPRSAVFSARAARWRRTCGSRTPTAARWCSTATWKPTSSSSRPRASTCACRRRRACSTCSTAASMRRSPIPAVTADPLKFRDQRRYSERLKEARAKAERDDAVTAARGTLDGLAVVMAVQDFEFMGGSLGMAAGEALISGMGAAVEQTLPLRAVRLVGRRAHAGGHPVAHADAAHHRRGAGSARGETALRRGAHASDDRRRHGVLRHAGRRPYRRAGGAHRLRRAPA
jgi:hypothetical protein